MKIPSSLAVWLSGLPLYPPGLPGREREQALTSRSKKHHSKGYKTPPTVTAVTRLRPRSERSPPQPTDCLLSTPESKGADTSLGVRCHIQESLKVVVCLDKESCWVLLVIVSEYGVQGGTILNAYFPQRLETMGTVHLH